MGKLKDKKWPYIVLSILLAVALWFYARSNGDTASSKSLDRVPIVFTGMETLQSRGLMLVSGEDVTVNIKVKGPWTTMNRVTRDTVSAVADLSRITEPGEYSLSYDVTSSDQLGISVQDRDPWEITVVVANYAEKDVPVEAVFDGSVADGFQTGKILVSPETIRLSGSAELVEQVECARVTITGAGLSETVSGEYRYDLVDIDGAVLEANGLTCSAETVVVTLPVVTTRDIPLTVDLLPGGGATGNGDVKIDINPAVISVSGELEDVEALDQIVLGTIDLSKVTNTGIFTFNVVLPSTLTNVSEVSTATVTITFNDLVSKVVTVTNIEVANVPDGYTASAVTKSKDVLVRGTQEAIDMITPSHIHIIADASKAPTATGRYTVSASVALEGVADAGAVGDYSIVISLTQ